MPANRDFEVRNELAADHVADLIALYSETWWAADRTRDDVELMLANSDVVFALIDSRDNRLSGFARVLSDRIYFAMILDVIVAREHQGSGLGRCLLDAIVAHPLIAPIKSVELVCQPELVSFYRRWGFTQDVGRSTLMRRPGPSHA
ncbi:MAG TPA: GNAT family N-acetyltransferase [Solirubrobacteraceae bacterium]